MTNFTAQAHIETLARHGATIKAGDERIALTAAFYRQAVASCERGGCNAITYGLILPGIDEPMMLAIWRDGHVDSGSAESIYRVLDR